MSATPSLRYGATCVGPPAGFAVKLTSRCALRSDNHGESDDEASLSFGRLATDRKSTRLNSSHLVISYAVFCLKKKKKKNHMISNLERLRLHSLIVRHG